MKRFLIIPEEDVHVHQDVVEVHHSGSLQLLLIKLVDFRKTAALHPAVCLQQIFAGGILVPGDQIVFGIRDAPENVLGFVVLILIQMQLFQADLHRGLRIRGVVDRELLGIAQKRSVSSQKPDEHGVERPHHNSAGTSFPHHQRYALLHLSGRFFSKSQG